MKCPDCGIPMVKVGEPFEPDPAVLAMLVPYPTQGATAQRWLCGCRGTEAYELAISATAITTGPIHKLSCTITVVG